MARLSVIIPVFNEAQHLTAFVERLLASPCPIAREFIFVDDGSRDGSYSILEQLSKRFPIRVLLQEPNQGKGAAVRRGIREATGEFIMIQDADFEYDPSEVPALLKPLLEDRADVVYGSRFLQSLHPAPRTSSYVANRLLTWLSNLFSGLHLTDVETCYKIFRADLLQAMNLTSERFGIEIELTAYVGKTASRFCECPISYHPRTRSQGKKINWKDGVAALRHLVYYNFFRSRRTSFHKLPEKYLPRS